MTTLSTPRAPGKPPRLRSEARLPRGPRAYRGGQEIVAGPGEPPDGFVRPTTSKTEWYVYWSLREIFGVPNDARQPPFNGGYPVWAYQQGTGGDGTRSRPDFVVYRGKRPLILRVQTEYRHLFTDNQKQTYDRIQRIVQSGRFEVRDLYDWTFINDPTGEAVVVRVKEALGLIERADPIIAGTALRGSRQD